LAESATHLPVSADTLAESATHLPVSADTLAESATHLPVSADTLAESATHLPVSADTLADVTPTIHNITLHDIEDKEKKRVSNNAPAGYTLTHSQIVQRAYFHIKGRLPRPDEPTTADWAWAKEAAPHMGADLDETIQAHLRRHAYKSPESLLQGITLDWYATASSGPPPAPDLDALTARIMGGKT